MITVNGISRKFGDREVLRDVTFEVQGGRMTGFVGSNGAGKTTTMRIILGVLSADRGSVTFQGSAIIDRDRARFGYMPEERGLYPKSKILDQLVYLARLHGMSSAQARTSATALLERLGLSERMNDSVESLSLGNQQRVQIAAALVHEPAALVLDEPFSGLDPYAIEAVLGVLRDYAAKGVPVLFSSHQLDVVERLCDDVVVIGQGQVLASGSREELRAQHSTPAYEIELEGAQADAGWIRDAEGVHLAHLDGRYARFAITEPGAEQAILRDAITRGGVKTFAPVRPTLAEIFKEVTQ